MVAKVLDLAAEAERTRPLILVVDDDVVLLRWAERILRHAGYDVATAQDGRAALDMMSTQRPELILLDLHMPELDGFGVIAHMRASDELRHVPIMVMSGSGDGSLKVAGLDCGANDYLTKPLESAELLARVRAHLRISETARRWREDCLRDPVTHLCSRRGVIDALAREVARATREKVPLAVLYIDLDGFKSVNDRFGHQMGDDVLTEFGQVLVEVCRKGDIAGRMGGDEFVVILPGVGRTRAKQVLDRIASAHAEADALAPLRASVGIAVLFEDVWPAEQNPVEALLDAADVAMYAEKRRRRDRQR
jgi:diguanylate cyclase (GGDEF)-like protein